MNKHFIKAIFAALTIFIFSCNNSNNDFVDFTIDEVEAIYAFPFSTVQSDSIYVFCENDNKKFNEIVNSLYLGNDDLGYDIKKSISSYILNRENTQISNKLSKLNYWHLEFVKDSSFYKKNLIIFSEPVFFNNELLNITWSVKNSRKEKKDYSLFLNKGIDGFSIVLFYDAQLDMYYEPTE